MNTKKSWFSYAIWGIFTVLLCLYFSIYINKVCQLNKFTKNGTVFTVCIGFISIFAVFCLLCFLWDKYGRNYIQQISLCTKRLWEIFLALSLFAGAILTRVYWFFHHFVTPLGSLQYYDAAIIREGGSVSAAEQGISCLYTRLLSFLFSFLGNRQEAGILMQCVLQLAGIVLFYFAVRRLTGKITALVSLGILSFFPGAVRYCFMLTPEILFFFLFSCLLFLLSTFQRGEEKKGRRTAAAIFITAFLGLCGGYLFYLDITGILFFAALLFVLLSKKRKKGKTLVYIISSGLGILLGFGLFLFFEASVSDSGFIVAFSRWRQTAFGSTNLSFILAGPDITSVASIAGCFFAAWYVLSFPFLKQDKGSFYMLFLLVISMFVFFQKTNMDYQILGTMCWSVLAGLGVTSVFQERESRLWHKNKEKDVDSMTEEDTDIIIEDIEEKPAIQFIENPLPLPKKHVKRTMDYKFHPEEAMMKYDIEIAENDDFDLP